MTLLIFIMPPPHIDFPWLSRICNLNYALFNIQWAHTILGFPHYQNRFGIGRFTTEEEVDYTVSRTVREVRRLREMSPLWEMFQDGVDIKSIQWTQH